MKILVTGGTGLVGRHLEDLSWNSKHEFVFVSSKQFDLTEAKEAKLLIKQEEPDWVIHLAAKVGGITANIGNQCSFYEDNTQININILQACRIWDVPRFTGMLSTCAYPNNMMSGLDMTSGAGPEDFYPMKEDMLHAGPPAKSNFGYGIAKRALATHIDMCNDQFGTKYNYIIPCNLYGLYDNFSDSGHFVANLIRKIYEAEKEITLYGTGKPLRQFMYAGDLARVIIEMINEDITESFNIAYPHNLTIENIAEEALFACAKDGDIEIKFDPLKPDGQYRKDVSIDKFMKLFPDFKFTSLYKGIQKTYNHYKSLRENVGKGNS